MNNPKVVIDWINESTIDRKVTLIQLGILEHWINLQLKNSDWCDADLMQWNVVRKFNAYPVSTIKI